MISNRRVGFPRGQQLNQGAVTSLFPVPQYNVTVTTSNVSYANRTDTINFHISTNLTNNQKIYLTTTGAPGIAFEDGSTTALATLAANGNITISRQIAISSTDVNDYVATFQLRTGDYIGDIFFTQNANISTSNVVSSGGNISTVNGYLLHEIAATSTNLAITYGLDINAEYLVIGGGGTAGGWYANSAGLSGSDISIWSNSRGKWAGGGGGGQVLNGNTSLVEGSTYPITAGIGGRTFLAGISGIPGGSEEQLYRFPANGNSSVAFGTTAIGGGAGSWVLLNLRFTGNAFRYQNHVTNTGGGGRPDANCATSAIGFRGGDGVQIPTGFSPSAGFNNAAFTWDTISDLYMFAGGGAGANGNGTSGTFNGPPGSGGPGLPNTITGSEILYSAGGRAGGGGLTGTASFGANGLGWGNYGSGGSAGTTTTVVDGRDGAVFVKYPAYQKTIQT